MITVKYDDAAPEMEIEGHAQSAEYGRDLVCAAASILLLTLEESLANDWEADADIIKRPGYAKVICGAGGDAPERCREMYRTVFTGYELLESRFPENVRTELRQDWRE